MNLSNRTCLFSFACSSCASSTSTFPAQSSRPRNSIVVIPCHFVASTLPRPKSTTPKTKAPAYCDNKQSLQSSLLPSPCPLLFPAFLRPLFPLSSPSPSPPLISLGCLRRCKIVWEPVRTPFIVFRIYTDTGMCECYA